MLMRKLFLTFFITFASISPANSSGISESATPWPVVTCGDSDHWLVFTGLRLCIAKDDVDRVHHLNLREPSLSVDMKLGGRSVDITFVRFETDAAVAGIHDHLGVSPQDVFRILSGDLEHEGRAVVEEILFVSDRTRVEVYEGEGIVAYALVRPVEEHSSIYVFRPGKHGLVKLAGPLDDGDVESLLSVMHW